MTYSKAGSEHEGQNTERMILSISSGVISYQFGLDVMLRREKHHHCQIKWATCHWTGSFNNPLYKRVS